MNIEVTYFKHSLLPLVFMAATVLVASLLPQVRDWLLPIMFLLLPFFDFVWRMPGFKSGRLVQFRWLALSVIISGILFKRPDLLDVFTLMVLIAAIPEEWFFRAYLQKQLGNNMVAILFVSLIFSVMHFIAHNSIVAWFVFIPSVVFGWIYKKTDDLILIIMLHALSNLVYYIYIESYIVKLFAR